MKRSARGLATCLVLGLAPVVAAAQPSRSPPAGAPAGVADAELAYLQQRVSEELAADGVLLSRIGVTLHLEQVGGVMLVSLIDPRTHRASASTRIDRVPTDRDGAVATITPVVANLAAQLVGRATGDGSTDDARLAEIERTQRELLARQERDREEAQRREQAELQYNEEAIRFGRVIAVWAYAGGGVASAGTSARWTASRGETGGELSGPEFYETVGRPDLAKAYRRRKRIAVRAFVTAGAILVGGFVVAAVLPETDPDYRGCSTSNPSDFCHINAELEARQQDEDRSTGIVFTTTTASIVAALVGTWYLVRRHPVSERTARELGGDYNRRLRVRLGLPVASPPPRMSDLSLGLTPYAAPGGGGLALTGTF